MPARDRRLRNGYANFDRCPQGIDRQLRRVVRGWRKAAQRLDDRIAADDERVGYRQALYHLGETRGAGDGRHAALGAEARFDDHAVFQTQAHFQHVATHGIVQPCDGIGSRQLADVARVFEMFQNQLRIHNPVCGPCSEDAVQDR